MWGERRRRGVHRACKPVQGAGGTAPRSSERRRLGCRQCGCVPSRRKEFALPRPWHARPGALQANKEHGSGLGAWLTAGVSLAVRSFKEVSALRCSQLAAAGAAAAGSCLDSGRPGWTLLPALSRVCAGRVWNVPQLQYRLQPRGPPAQRRRGRSARGESGAWRRQPAHRMLTVGACAALPGATKAIVYCDKVLGGWAGSLERACCHTKYNNFWGPGGVSNWGRTPGPHHGMQTVMTAEAGGTCEHRAVQSGALGLCVIAGRDVDCRRRAGGAASIKKKEGQAWCQG